MYKYYICAFTGKTFDADSALMPLDEYSSFNIWLKGKTVSAPLDIRFVSCHFSSGAQDRFKTLNLLVIAY